MHVFQTGCVCVLQVRNMEEHRRQISHLLICERKKRRKLEALGIEYDFPGYSKLAEDAGLHKTPTHTMFVNSGSDSE